MQQYAYAGTVATLGYQHLSKKWLTALYVLKPFYEQNSSLVQSALKAQTGGSISRLHKIVNITVGGDVKLSNKIDIGATAGVDHIIRIENRDKSLLVFDPSFYTYAGTQQFSKTYTQKKSGDILLPVTEQQVIKSGYQFNILAYEVSMPVIYAKGKMQLLVTPSYILPQNLLTTAADRSDVSEKGENMFYGTIGVKLIL
jgi:hypothetical protein